ncbi:hypothetical protein AAZX31_03G057900 [Glycine max]|uniref:Kunitz-type trypsin inhibitor-like 2 protein n=1 Tax=Glycine soja TaxID=3848 RepID=A0A0B2Q045_GLYSO|nr:factor Xa inhibitor BuXI-like [Glycine soja]KAG5071358.1 hypothetical protein JHK86_006569 [Glycine max]KHN13172.1 Kunitz-type trypsin inhibitor-like 2 protein [Glycine soja]
MKTINSLFGLLFLLLIAFTMKPAVASGVHDTDDRMLENGGDYFILPSFDEEGGGVTLASIGVTHPLAVVQSSSKNHLGLPASIKTKETMIIFTDEMVSIKFTNVPDYNNASTWTLVMDEFVKVWYVGIGNVADYPSHRIKTGKFQIKEDNFDYKLVFCADANTTSCEDVGVYVDGEQNRRLVLSEVGGVAVKFMNADKSRVAFD